MTMFTNVLLGLSILSIIALLISAAMSKTLTWKTCLACAVLFMCGHQLASNELHKGLDFAGGTSLTYAVDLSTVPNKKEALKNTIRVMRDRVDPNGLLNLNFSVEQGNRIVVQMPKPSKQVQKFRDDLDTAREQISASGLNMPKLKLLIESSNTIKPESLTEFTRGFPGRVQLIQGAEKAFADKLAAHKAYKAADSDEKRIELVEKVTDTNLAYRKAINNIADTNLDIVEVNRVLDLSDKKAKNQKISIRQSELARLIKKYPTQKELIDKLVIAYDTYAKERGTLDDPMDLIRLLKGSGVLEFRIKVQPSEVPNINDLRQTLAERGPGRTTRNTTDPMIWLRVDDPSDFFNDTNAADLLRPEITEEQTFQYCTSNGYVGTRYGDGFYVLMWNTPDKAMTHHKYDWAVFNATASVDGRMLPAVAFRLDAKGAQLMSNMTGPHVGRQMGIILNNKLYSAPTIQVRLSSDILVSGGSTGFNKREQDYLLRTLKAGSLDAGISEEPIAIRTLGSKFGEDNLKQGLESAILAIIAVAAFMAVYYFFTGLIANAALAANIVIILGIMAMKSAAFTLPGIAGIILTIGMCVDANVLVFERIREELQRGENITTALRLGYSRAMSAIIDGNITNLIVCAILYKTASADVRGFAVTLMIGIGATLFTSLFMTRIIFELWNKAFGIKRLQMLPTVFPSIGKLTHPNIEWISKRGLFFTASSIVMILSIVLCVSRGNEMLGIEFRAGTDVTVELAKNPGDPQGRKLLTLKLDEIRNKIKTTGKWFADGFDDSSLSSEDHKTFIRLQKIIEQRTLELSNEAVDKAVATKKKMIHGRGDFDEKDAQKTLDEVANNARITADIDAAAATALKQLRSAEIVRVGEQLENFEISMFSVRSTISDSRTVDAVIKVLFEDHLDTVTKLDFDGSHAERLDQITDIVFPVTRSSLGNIINEPDLNVDVSGHIGGVVIVLRNIDTPATIDDIQNRIEAMQHQPDFQDQQIRNFDIIGLELDAQSNGYTSVAIVTHDPNISYLEDQETWDGLATHQWRLVRTAMQRETSLSKVSNFTPTVARALTQQAIVALLLSFIAIVAYIWFRFGSFRYGLAAIIALVHDVVITVGLVALSGYIFEISWVHDYLFIDAFKINLVLIAAVLTIIGYSLNDTIVVFDRIRENRGKLARASHETINNSINQTVSRTLLTSGTTLLAVLMLYIFGGAGIREFAFALLVGVIVGTYSSVAIASPVLVIATGRKTKDSGTVQSQNE